MWKFLCLLFAMKRSYICYYIICMIISLTFRSIFISIFLLFSLPVARFLFNISFLFINKCLPVKRLAHIHKSPEKFRHPVVFQLSDYFVMAFRLGCQVRSYIWWWWWWWIVLVVWLTDERRLALFPAGTVVRDSHHRESPTRREQGLNLRRTWVQA